MTALPNFSLPDLLPSAAPFWAAVERGALALPRCSMCGRWQWYPEAAGTDCTGGTLIWEDVPGTGTVHTFTRVHRSFLPGGRQDPYVVGSIDLDGVDGPRLVANLDDAVDLAVGMAVRVRFERVGRRNHPVFDRIRE